MIIRFEAVTYNNNGSILCDLLWALPADDDCPGWNYYPGSNTNVWGQSVTEAFLQRNELTSIIRGNRMIKEV